MHHHNTKPEQPKQTLKGFMRESVLQKEPVSYVASTRFIGEDGNPLEWKIRTLSNKEIDKMTDECTKRFPVPSTREFRTETDGKLLNKKIAVASIAYPNLNDAELQDSWGVAGAEDLLLAMLTPGELADLYVAVLNAQDIDTGFDEKVKK